MQITSTPVLLYPFLKSWTAETGTLVVNNNDFANYDNTKYLIRITTRNIVTVLEDEFEITFRDKCHDVEIDGDPLTVKGMDNSIKTLESPFTYHMWEYW